MHSAMFFDPIITQNQRRLVFWWIVHITCMALATEPTAPPSLACSPAKAKASHWKDHVDFSLNQGKVFYRVNSQFAYQQTCTSRGPSIQDTARMYCSIVSLWWSLMQYSYESSSKHTKHTCQWFLLQRRLHTHREDLSGTPHSPEPCEFGPREPKRGELGLMLIYRDMKAVCS